MLERLPRDILNLLLDYTYVPRISKQDAFKECKALFISKYYSKRFEDANEIPEAFIDQLYKCIYTGDFSNYDEMLTKRLMYKPIILEIMSDEVHLEGKIYHALECLAAKNIEAWDFFYPLLIQEYIKLHEDIKFIPFIEQYNLVYDDFVDTHSCIEDPLISKCVFFYLHDVLTHGYENYFDSVDKIEDRYNHTIHMESFTCAMALSTILLCKDTSSQEEFMIYFLHKATKYTNLQQYTIHIYRHCNILWKYISKGSVCLGEALPISKRIRDKVVNKYGDIKSFHEGFRNMQKAFYCCRTLLKSSIFYGIRTIDDMDFVNDIIVFISNDEMYQDIHGNLGLLSVIAFKRLPKDLIGVIFYTIINGGPDNNENAKRKYLALVYCRLQYIIKYADCYANKTSRSIITELALESGIYEDVLNVDSYAVYRMPD